MNKMAPVRYRLTTLPPAPRTTPVYSVSAVCSTSVAHYSSTRYTDAALRGWYLCPALTHRH